MMIQILALLVSSAFAGSPEIDALAHGIQRGMPDESVITIIGTLPQLTSDDIIELLRAGLSSDALNDAGYKASFDDIQTARLQGPWVRPVYTPKEEVESQEYFHVTEDDVEDDSADDKGIIADLDYQSSRIDLIEKRRKVEHTLAGVGLGLSVTGMIVTLASLNADGYMTSDGEHHVADGFIVGGVISTLGGVALGISWVY